VVIEKLMANEKILSIFIEPHQDMIFLKIVFAGLMKKMFFQCYYSINMILIDDQKKADVIVEIILKDIAAAENRLLKNEKGAIA
jgi:hypothetical protein